MKKETAHQEDEKEEERKKWFTRDNWKFIIELCVNTFIAATEFFIAFFFLISITAIELHFAQIKN